MFSVPIGPHFKDLIMLEMVAIHSPVSTTKEGSDNIFFIRYYEEETEIIKDFELVLVENYSSDNVLTKNCSRLGSVEDTGHEIFIPNTSVKSTADFIDVFQDDLVVMMSKMLENKIDYISYLETHGEILVLEGQYSEHVIFDQTVTVQVPEFNEKDKITCEFRFQESGMDKKLMKYLCGCLVATGKSMDDYHYHTFFERLNKDSMALYGKK